MASSSTPSQATAAGTKEANKPFLVHQKWKKEQAGKAGSGKVVRPAGVGGAALGALKWVVIALITSVFASRMVTETWNWGYKGKYSNPAAVSTLSSPP